MSKTASRTGLLAALAAVALMVFTAPSAHAALGIESLTIAPAANKWTPAPTQAGGHPDINIDLEVEQSAPLVPAETLKKVKMQLPPGLVLNPQAFTPCPDLWFWLEIPCPPATRVGELTVKNDINTFSASMHILEAGQGEAARIGLKVFGGGPGALGGLITATVSPDGEFAIEAVADEVTRAGRIALMNIHLWGVPADYNGSGEDPKPFVTYPARCEPLRPASMSISSYQDPDAFSTMEASMPVATGCDAVAFDASIDAQPSTTAADSPTGFEFGIDVAQTSEPDVLSTARLKTATVTLPDGMTVSPSGGDGLGSCAPGEIMLGSPAKPTCPDASKIGTVAIESPLLPQELVGEVYLAHQGNNPFGSTLALYLVARGPGVMIKLAGRVDPDPVTGRLEVTFDRAPDLPFSSLRLEFKDGPRAPLATPPSCGEKTVSASLAPWSGGDAVEATDTFNIDCPGSGGFAPEFSAGALSAAGGASAPFVLKIDRNDRDDYLAGLSVDLPAGLLAHIQGVPQCGDNHAAAGTCGIGSRIGTATVAAGPGARPIRLPGTVSLTGPYKGAPFGLSVAVPARVGPLDLGTVVVRQALHVDRDDASVSVVSDPLPQIVEGIPIRLRTVHVAVDRPGFMVNPTSCDPKRINGSLTSIGGMTASVSAPFSVEACRPLAFSPRVKLRLAGRAQRAPGKHPGLRAILVQESGQANLTRVRVKLPSSLALDSRNANDVCSYEDGLASKCDRSSRIGRAAAYSPLLNRPLKGLVHLVEGVRFDKETGNRIGTLPTLLLKLRGEIEIDLRAKTSVAGKSLVATFPTIPDAPVSKVSVRLKAGGGGILAVTGERHLCSRSHSAVVETDGQNGRRHDSVTRVKTPCRPRAKRRVRSR